MSVLPDTVNRRLAAQHGLVTRRQLLHEAARPHAVVDGWIRRRLLLKVHRGVYRLPGAPETDHQRLLAAVLRCGDNALAGPYSSCALHGLEGFRVGGTIDVAVHPARQLHPLPFTVTPMPVSPPDRNTVDAIPALSATRGLIEMSTELAQRAWRVGFDSARRQGLTSLHWMERRARALPDRSGSPLVLGLLGSGILLPDGEGERSLQRLLTGFQPQPEWGVTDLVPGRRLDCAWHRILFTLEFDGRDHHVLPTDRDADGIRDLECEAHGVKVLRITKGMVDHDPARVRQLIEQAFLRRSQEFTGRR